MSAGGDESKTSCGGWDNSSCEGTPYCPPRCPRFVDDEGVARIARPLEQDEFDDLVAMYDSLDSDSRTQGLPPTTRSGIENWLSSLVERGWNLVVEGDDGLVAHTAAVPTSTGRPELVVFVHQSVRERGIGTELLKHLIAHTDARGHDGLTLNVSAGNDRAIAVYQNIGFDVVEGAQPAIEMALSMDDPIAERVQLVPAERET
jgi:ribosomal protein S18 acetylase RimI-like enzyme